MRTIPQSQGDVTGLLLRWRQGNADALDALVPLVQQELHQMARRCMAGERAGRTLQPTALVNEAYVRLLDVQRVNWQNRAHFLAMAARVMRRVLVDAARYGARTSEVAMRCASPSMRPCQSRPRTSQS
jgi:RNA polymerase sigma factor (TIGR02999 family)